MSSLLTDVLQQRDDWVEGSIVEELRISLAPLPLSLHTIALSLLFNRLQSALLDSRILQGEML